MPTIIDILVEKMPEELKSDLEVNLEEEHFESIYALILFIINRVSIAVNEELLCHSYCGDCGELFCEDCDCCPKCDGHDDSCQTERNNGGCFEHHQRKEDKERI